LKVAVTPRPARLAARKQFLGVVLTEDPVTTKVPSGENAGKTLVEHHAVRKFAYEFLDLDGTAARTSTFELTAEPGWEVKNLRVAAFFQDPNTGAVHQAEAIPWLDPARDRDRNRKASPAHD